jgi:hypothetical protein
LRKPPALQRSASLDVFLGCLAHTLRTAYD